MKARTITLPKDLRRFALSEARKDAIADGETRPNLSKYIRKLIAADKASKTAAKANHQQEREAA